MCAFRCPLCACPSFCLSEGLLSSGREESAVRLLLRGLEAGLWPREPLIDRVIEALCAAGEPGAAGSVMAELGNTGGWQPTTVHHNSLLMAMVRPLNRSIDKVGALDLDFFQ